MKKEKTHCLAIEVKDSKAFNPNAVIGYIGNKEPIVSNFSDAAKFWTGWGVERQIKKVKELALPSDYVLKVVKYNRYTRQFE